MNQAKCIQKFRNKRNQIYGYRLQDQQGEIIDVSPTQLKTAIKNKQIHITNLTLTSDNRLIDTTPTQQQPQITQTQRFLNKAKILGFQVQEIPTVCGHNVCIASKDQDHILFIPPEVTAIHEDYTNTSIKYEEIIKELKGNLKVLGGQSLVNAYSIFSLCQVQTLDLSNFDTSNVTSMRNMFWI